MGDKERSRGITGRGAAGNPKNRFERIEVEPDPAAPGEQPPLETVYLRDRSRSIIARNDSPDIGFDASINPYRGCSHGCVYFVCGETPVLMANGGICLLKELGVGDEIFWDRHTWSLPTLRKDARARTLERKETGVPRNAG